VHDLRTIFKQFLRSPRAFLAKASAASERLELEQQVASGVAPLRPVYDDLPNVCLRTITVDDQPPALDVLIPGLQHRHLSGGPNTALNLTYRLAAAGVPVRYVSTDLPHDDADSLRRHCAGLTGVAETPPNVSFASMHDRSVPTAVGYGDVFYSTAWWTAHYANDFLRRTQHDEFLYMVQDFEPGFYKWSCEYALATETYSMPMRAVICGKLLAEYLQSEAVGHFAEPGFMERCLVFEPAIDRSRFFFDPIERGRRRLLFYARPEAPRNLFEIGLLALRRAVDRGAFPAPDWDLWFIGGQVPPRDLGHGIVIRQHPWLDYDGYASLLRSCDAGLSLMLSPHTSYPPLEMAACGATVVTNTFANKTAERLGSYSDNLIPVTPSVDAIADGLVAASERTSDTAARARGADLEAPASWDEAFAHVVPRLVEAWRASVGT
jgi:hypothetical protein